MIQSPTSIEESNDKDTGLMQEQIATFQNSVYSPSIAAKKKEITEHPVSPPHPSHAPTRCLPVLSK